MCRPRCTLGKLLVYLSADSSPVTPKGFPRIPSHDQEKESGGSPTVGSGASQVIHLGGPGRWQEIEYYLHQNLTLRPSCLSGIGEMYTSRSTMPAIQQ